MGLQGRLLELLRHPLLHHVVLVLQRGLVRLRHQVRVRGSAVVLLVVLLGALLGILGIQLLKRFPPVLLRDVLLDPLPGALHLLAIGQERRGVRGVLVLVLAAGLLARGLRLLAELLLAAVGALAAELRRKLLALIGELLRLALLLLRALLVLLHALGSLALLLRSLLRVLALLLRGLALLLRGHLRSLALLLRRALRPLLHKARALLCPLDGLRLRLVRVHQRNALAALLRFMVLARAQLVLLLALLALHRILLRAQLVVGRIRLLALGLEVRMHLQAQLLHRVLLRGRVHLLPGLLSRRLHRGAGLLLRLLRVPTNLLLRRALGVVDAVLLLAQLLVRLLRALA